MKTLLALAAAAFAMSSPILADIPPEENQIQRLTYEGEAAEKLSNSLDVKRQRNDGRIRGETVKVLRAEDGLFQIVCVMSGGHGLKPSYNCVVEVSLDGKEIPKLPPPRIRG